MTGHHEPAAVARALRMAALTIRTLGTVPAGTLHARVFGFMAAADFIEIVSGLEATGIIESMPGGILRWVGNPALRQLN